MSWGFTRNYGKLSLLKPFTDEVTSLSLRSFSSCPEHLCPPAHHVTKSLHIFNSTHHLVPTSLLP